MLLRFVCTHFDRQYYYMGTRFGSNVSKKKRKKKRKCKMYYLFLGERRKTIETRVHTQTAKSD